MATLSDPAPTKKARNTRKPLKQKNEIAEQTPASPISVKKSTQKTKSFEKDLEEMQSMLEKLKIEKEKTEELLKEKDEILKRKEEELETRGMEQEKLKLEVKKLQKMKEFKPNMTFPFAQPPKEGEEDNKGKKKKKDCPERKRPSTPYILWCKDQWNEVKKENPNVEFKEMSNILGAKWKNVTAEEKKPYEERYQAEKESYLKVIAQEKREGEAMKLLEDEQKQKTAMELLDQYLQFIQESDKDQKKNKKEKDPLKPKQPMSAFLLFSQERRAELSAEKNMIEIAKITGEEWKNMSDKQKAPFEEVAKKNKEKYLQEMEAYKLKKEEEAMDMKKEEEELMKLHKQEAMQLLKKKEKADNMIKKNKEEKQKKKKKEQEDVDPNKPKRPASSFFLFSKETRKILSEERPETNNSTLTALISIKWKELGEEERQTWNAKAAKAMETYKKELEQYNEKAAKTKKP